MFAGQTVLYSVVMICIFLKMFLKYNKSCICRILTSGLHTPLTQYKHPDMVWGLIKLTRGVCRGLQCYAASPEKLFSFFEKTTMGLPGWCNITRWKTVFQKRQPGVSLADVTLLVGVHKCLLNFWLKRVEHCYIRVHQVLKTKSWVLLTFVWKEQKEIYYVKGYLWGVYPT